MKIVVKLGGATMEDAALLQRAAQAVKQLASEHQVAVVHGGGAALTRMLGQMGKTSEFIDGLRVPDAADVMGPKSRGNHGLIFKKHARKLFEIRVALGFLKKNGRIRSVLTRFCCLIIPICAFHQSDCEASAARTAPFDQVTQVGF